MAARTAPLPSAPTTGTGAGTTVRVLVDGAPVDVPVGATVLEAADAAGIHIPTLCHHPDLRDVGACRVCVVDVAGQSALQAACTYPVTGPTEVATHGGRVDAARRDVVELLLSEHTGECRACHGERRCELHQLAAEVGAGPCPFPGREPSRLVDLLGPAVSVDLSACIGCLRCVRACSDLQDVGVLGVVGRGSSTHVSTYRALPLSQVSCIGCGQCIAHCPTGALQAVDGTGAALAALRDPTKHVVIQTAPAPRAAIGEDLGLPAGTAVTWQLTTALRRLGFDRVFDTTFAADLTVVEEAAELLVRMHRTLVLGDTTQPLPQFTSCSPGWVKDLEHRYPEYLANLSTCRSPQQMFGSLIRTWYAGAYGLDADDVVSVSLMPCTAKKFEAARPELTHGGRPDVDVALTTRELARMIQDSGLVLTDLPPSDFDDPFGTATGSGVLFGTTGGVMEAALRTVLEWVTGRPVEEVFPHADVMPVRGFAGVRYAEVTVDEVGPVPPLLRHLLPDLEWLRGVTLRVAVAHGGAEVHRVMADIRSGGLLSTCHFIEFMACPGGCLGGGGQPVPTSAAVRAARARAVYAEDEHYGRAGRPRKSHENPAVQRLYRDVLTDGPGGPTSHRLLHTAYVARGTFVPEER